MLRDMLIAHARSVMHCKVLNVLKLSCVEVLVATRYSSYTQDMMRRDSFGLKVRHPHFTDV